MIKDVLNKNEWIDKIEDETEFSAIVHSGKSSWFLFCSEDETKTKLVAITGPKFKSTLEIAKQVARNNGWNGK